MSKEITQVASTTRGEHTAISAIEIVDLSKSFGNFQAVDHLTLTIQQGEIF